MYEVRKILGCSAQVLVYLLQVFPKERSSNKAFVQMVNYYFKEIDITSAAADFRDKL